jgi:hypothetical protein
LERSRFHDPNWRIRCSYVFRAQSVCRAFGLCGAVEVLPDAVYRRIVDGITNPDTQFLSALLETSVHMIEAAFVTNCAYDESHRRANKFYIYGYAMLVIDPSQIMASGHLRKGWPLESLTRVMDSLPASHLQPLKVKLNSAQISNP